MRRAMTPSVARIRAAQTVSQPRIAGLAVALVALALQYDIVVSRDVAWLAIAAGRLLAGGAYGADIMEISPPGGVWIYAPAAMLHGLGIAWPLAIKIYLAAFLGLITGFCQYLMPAPWRNGAAGMALILGALCVTPLSGAEFGQKDELAFLLLAPLLAILLRRTLTPDHFIPRLVLLLAGCLAGLGGDIKPPLALAIPALWVVYTRRRGGLFQLPELWATSCVGMAGAIASLFSPWWQFTLIYARAWASFNNPEWQVGLALAPAALLGALLWRVSAWREPNGRTLATLFGGATFGAAILMLMQHKFWEYHLIPARILVAWWALALYSLAPQQTNQRRWCGRVLPAVVVFLLILQSPALITLRNKLAETSFAESHGLTAHLYNYLNALGPGASWVFLDTGIGGLYPAAADGSEKPGAFPLAIYVLPAWGSRFPHLWQIPWIVSTLRSQTATKPDRKKAIALQDMLFSDLSADLDRYRPSLVIISTRLSHQAIDGDFDLAGYLRAGPGFGPRLARDYHVVPALQQDTIAMLRNGSL